MMRQNVVRRSGASAPPRANKTVYFDPSVTARAFTIDEMAFVLAVLNDHRAWGQEWTLAPTRAAADWIVALEHQDFVEAAIQYHRGPNAPPSATITSGLSVTFMRERRSLLSYENWTTVPRPVAHVYTIEDYRTYLVLHECGHSLGLNHSRCSPRRSVRRLGARGGRSGGRTGQSGSGRTGPPAPVMMQQTRGLRACSPSPWPRPYERRKLRPRSRDGP